LPWVFGPSSLKEDCQFITALHSQDTSGELCDVWNGIIDRELNYTLAARSLTSPVAIRILKDPLKGFVPSRVREGLGASAVYGAEPYLVSITNDQCASINYENVVFLRAIRTGVQQALQPFLREPEEDLIV
jgi:hypothetical protein